MKCYNIARVDKAMNCKCLYENYKKKEIQLLHCLKLELFYRQLTYRFSISRTTL